MVALTKERGFSQEPLNECDIIAMPKKNTRQTPDGIIRSALRRVWMMSRERSTALRREGYCCEHCGVKNSKAKGKEARVIVHHKDLIDWKLIFSVLRAELLPEPEELTCLCDECHKLEHRRMKEEES